MNLRVRNQGHHPRGGSGLGNVPFLDLNVGYMGVLILENRHAVRPFFFTFGYFVYPGFSCIKMIIALITDSLPPSSILTE